MTAGISAPFRTLALVAALAAAGAAVADDDQDFGSQVEHLLKARSEKLFGVDRPLDATRRMFSESQSRFLLEVPPDRIRDLAANLHGVPFAVIGETSAEPVLRFVDGTTALAQVALADAVRAWQRPLDIDGTLAAEAAR